MQKPSGLTNLAILAMAVLLGVATMATPRVSSHPAPSDFHLDNAIRHVEAIAREPHPLGSRELAEVRGYLVSSLEGMGVETELQWSTAPDMFGVPGNRVDLVNVVARIPGTSSTGSVLLMAHYDTHPETPGANDNSAPVAAVLEAVRAIQAGEQLVNDIVVLFTDGEEPAGRFGATAFIEAHRWADDVAFVMNFEAAGGSGPALLAQTGVSQQWTVEQLSAAGPRPVAFSFLTDGVALFGEIGTDFDPFLARGNEGIHVAYLRGGSIYHTDRDSIDALNRDGLAHHGSYALAMARQVGRLDLSAIPEGQTATFFTLWPGMLARYSNGWAVALALLAAGAALIGVVVDIRRRGRTLGAVMVRFARILGGAIVGALVGTLAWMGLAAARPTMGSVEAYLYLMVMAGAAGALRWLIDHRRRRRPDVVSAVLAVWAALALVTAFLLPGASYLFSWPCLAAAIAWLAWPSPSRTGRVFRLAGVATVTGVLMVPAVDTFLSMAQPRPGNPDSELAEAFAVVALLAVLCFELLLPFLRRGPAPDEPVESSVPVGELVAA